MYLFLIMINGENTAKNSERRKFERNKIGIKPG